MDATTKSRLGDRSVRIRLGHKYYRPLALLLLTERSYGHYQYHRSICGFNHPPLRVIPINGVFWGALLLSEPVTGSMIAALVLILSGVILVNRAAAKKEKVEKVAVVSEQ